MGFILIPFLISPPDGLDSAQIRSKFWLQFLRLTATPWCNAYVTSGPVSSLVTLVTGISLEIPRVNLQRNGSNILAQSEPISNPYSYLMSS